RPAAGDSARVARGRGDDLPRPHRRRLTRPSPRVHTSPTSPQLFAADSSETCGLVDPSETDDLRDADGRFALFGRLREVDLRADPPVAVSRWVVNRLLDAPERRIRFVDRAQL